MIRIALKEAGKSIENHQHGSVITRSGSVISKGHNTRRSHPKYGYGPFQALHAEASAIRAAVNMGIDLRGTTIYVARSGHRLSKPCRGCHGMIKKYGISKVIYTGDNGEILTEYPLCELQLQ